METLVATSVLSFFYTYQNWVLETCLLCIGFHFAVYTFPIAHLMFWNNSLLYSCYYKLFTANWLQMEART